MTKQIDKQLAPMFESFARHSDNTGLHWQMSGAALNHEFLSPVMRKLLRQAYLQGVYDTLNAQGKIDEALE